MPGRRAAVGCLAALLLALPLAGAAPPGPVPHATPQQPEPAPPPAAPAAPVTALPAPPAATAPPAPPGAPTAAASQQAVAPLPQAIQERLRSAPAEGPAVRIGLSTDHRKVTIACDGPFRVLDPATKAPLWKDSYTDDLLVTTHGA